MKDIAKDYYKDDSDQAYGRFKTALSRQRKRIKTLVATESESEVHPQHQSRISSNLTSSQNSVSPVIAIPDEDTRLWTWKKWCYEFQGIELLNYEENWLNSMLEKPTQIIASRQIGKTTVLKLFCLRMLCESVYWFNEGKDRTILYISHDFKILKRMASFLRSNLLSNDAIVNFYGKLINTTKKDGLTESPQSLTQIRLRTLHNKSLVSLEMASPLANVRGNEYTIVVFDDLFDIKKMNKDPLKALELTNDIEEWITYDISPLCKGMKIISGTRYHKDDLYARNDAKERYVNFTQPLFEGDIPTFTILPHKDIISPTDIKVDQKINCSAPFLWSPGGAYSGEFEYSGTIEQNIMWRFHDMDDEIAFKQEYLCIPKSFDIFMDSGNLQEYKELPTDPTSMQWVIFIDPASGKTALSDVTSIALVGMFEGRFYIQDLIYGRWDGLEKMQQAEKFYDKALRTTRKQRINFFDENVRNQDFHNRLVRESRIQPIGHNPKDRGEKLQRINDNFGIDLKNKIVYINSYIDLSSKNQLLKEIDNFGSKHPDVLDSCDQAIYILRNKIKAPISRRIYN